MGHAGTVQRLARHLADLEGSWRAVTSAHDGRVDRVPGAVMAKCRLPVYENAVLLDPPALATVLGFFDDVDAFAIWSRADDPSCAAALVGAGLSPDERTFPMVADLREAESEPAESEPAETEQSETEQAEMEQAEMQRADDRGRADVELRRDVDPALVCSVNDLSPAHLLDVPGLHTYATADEAAVLAAIDVVDSTAVCFVATRPSARGRGLATALTSAALVDARSRGLVAASLQASPMAVGVYTRAGFSPAGPWWQEWVPKGRGPS